jgi:hypothetical protein
VLEAKLQAPHHAPLAAQDLGLEIAAVEEVPALDLARQPERARCARSPALPELRW